MRYWTAKSKAKTVKRFHQPVLENDSRGRKFEGVRNEYQYDNDSSVGLSVIS